MLAAIKLEVMTPSKESPDEGSIGLFLVLQYLFSCYSIFSGGSVVFQKFKKHNKLSNILL
jgi:hypothetical protein